jgi:hypothetical protein
MVLDKQPDTASAACAKAISATPATAVRCFRVRVRKSMSAFED